MVSPEISQLGKESVHEKSVTRKDVGVSPTNSLATYLQAVHKTHYKGSLLLLRLSH
jgi:hypothetical protein